MSRRRSGFLVCRPLAVLLAALLVWAAGALAPSVAAPSGNVGGAGASDPPGPVGGPRLGLADTTIVDPVGPSTPPLPQVSATSWLVANLDTGAVLAAHNPHQPLAPASTQKILTALTLIPRLPASATVTPTNADAGVEGSKVGLVPDADYRAEDAYRALLVVSGNDAANALARANGGIAPTVRQMNATAERLGAFDTVAKNPSGLDATGQVSSAYDLAVITRAALELPAFRDYVGTVRATMPAPGEEPYKIFTHNNLLVNYPGAFGVKNGYTVAARASFVGAATRDGHTLLVTLMRADPNVWREAAALLDWGFAAVEQVAPVGHLVTREGIAGTPAGAPAEEPAGDDVDNADQRATLAVGDPLATPESDPAEDATSTTMLLAALCLAAAAVLFVGVAGHRGRAIRRGRPTRGG